MNSKSTRLDVVDALRGFAVMAILLVHVLEHFIYFVYPEQTLFDKGLFTVVFSLFAGKSYAIFAILFGLTYYIQYTNQLSKGGDFGWRFVWRLLLLVLFATINAAFFPGGDVLLLFAIVGISLPIVRKLSDKWVLILVVCCLLQPIELYHYIMSLINPDFTLHNYNVGELYKAVGDAVSSGSWSQFFKTNITTGQHASLFWAIDNGRISQTIGLFLLGFLLGRKKMFVYSDKQISIWTTILIVSAIAAAPLYALKVQFADAPEVALIVQKSLGSAFDMWSKLAFTLVIISSFVLLYQKDKFKNITSNLRYYGKMSLTNYITQSIIGALIFFPIGLNLAPYTGFFYSLLIGIVIIIIQILFCKWWLNNHKQGPLEYLWHRMTWLK